MSLLENLESRHFYLYQGNLFSGDYTEDLYLSRASYPHEDRFYLSIFSKINGEMIRQGYIYFTLDFVHKTSSFIGTFVKKEYRNFHIGSLLVASWIDFCFQNGFDFLGVHPTQRKPFLIYLLKTYGFDIFDRSLYESRKEVIFICRSHDFTDLNKYLLFKDSHHELIFRGTHVCQEDNYVILSHLSDCILLDQVLVFLQNRKKDALCYQLMEKELAQLKSTSNILKHKKGGL